MRAKMLERYKAALLRYEAFRLRALRYDALMVKTGKVSPKRAAQIVAVSCRLMAKAEREMFRFNDMPVQSRTMTASGTFK